MDATESRRELAELVAELGASDERIARCDDAGLFALGVQLLLAPEGRHDARVVVERSGVGVERSGRLWRSWGLPAPDIDDVRFSDADVDVVAGAPLVEQLVGEETAYHTARVMSLAIARVAESEIAMLRETVERPLRETGADDAAVLRMFRDLLPFVLDGAQRTLLSLHTQHLVEQVRRQARFNPDARASHELAVVFVDMAGSTKLALDMPLEELDPVFAAFEEQCTHVLADFGLTLVKFLGDGVLFTSVDSRAASQGTSALLRELAASSLPSVRAGLAFGPVLARRGDYYGIPVILASRLSGVTDPSTMCVAAVDAHRFGLGDATAERTVVLKGFDEPTRVAVFRP